MMYRLCWTLLLGTLVGCGAGSYEQSLKRRAALAREDAPYQALYAAGTDIPGTNRTVRLPQIFKNAYQENSPHPLDKGGIDPARWQPPFLQIPGLRVCYEALGKDSKNMEAPFYCYLAAVSVQPAERVGFQTDLVDKLKENFPGAEWTPIDVQSREGTPLAWKKIVVKGEQQFLVPSGDKSTPTNMPGTFELWLHEGEAGDVLIGWRWPDELGEKVEVEHVKLVDFPQLTATTLGTKPEAPAAPDAEGQPAAQ